MLMQSMTNGWGNSMLSVVPKVDEDGKDSNSEFYIVDGAHRFTAVQQLIADGLDQWKGFEFPCYILPRITKSDQIAYAFDSLFP